MGRLDGIDRLWLALGLALVTVVVAVVRMPAQNPAPLTVASPSFTNNQALPKDFTPDGRNVSPALTWSAAPPATREFALILEDPDAGNPPPFVHWLIYKIPASAKGLPENISIDPAAPMPAGLTGAIQGSNGFRRNIYRGPAPPPGRPHLYHFIVYALDQPLALEAGLTRQQLLDAMKGHIVGQGEIVASYERTGPAAPAGGAPAGRGRGRGF